MRAAAGELVVCGGGAFNADLMARLGRAAGADVAVVASDDARAAADQVEAAAFAWLARAFVERQPGNVPRVTGAAGPRVLGALYPAAERGARSAPTKKAARRRLRRGRD